MEHLEPKNEIPSQILALIEDLTCDLQITSLSVEQLAARIVVSPVVHIAPQKDAAKQN